MDNDMARVKKSYGMLLFEATVLKIVFGPFGLMPLDMASWMGSKLARLLCPMLPICKVVRRNLLLAFPGKTHAEREQIMMEMWDNIGRYATEFPHMSKDKIATRVTLKGLEHVEAIKSGNTGSLWISGHFGNWEIMPRMAAEYGVPLMLVYRHSNNPLAEKIVQKVRARYHNGMIGKGTVGAMKILRALKQHQAVGILVDQKMNEGIPIPFFGEHAMTSDAFAQIALRMKVPVIVAFVRRVKGAHFELTVNKPIYFEGSSDNSEDVTRAVRQVYAHFEQWIRENPSQWFWVHRRWPKEIYKE